MDALSRGNAHGCASRLGAPFVDMERSTPNRCRQVDALQRGHQMVLGWLLLGAIVAMAGQYPLDGCCLWMPETERTARLWA